MEKSSTKKEADICTILARNIDFYIKKSEKNPLLSFLFNIFKRFNCKLRSILIVLYRLVINTMKKIKGLLISKVFKVLCPNHYSE